MKKSIKKIIPYSWLMAFHWIKAWIACWWYKNPTQHLKVIGITGTKGKSTTANFLWALLQTNGITTGLIGTANIRIGEKEHMNEYHMTMPSPFILQKLFAQMKDAGCSVVVMEVTSEGLKQFRHLGIHFAGGIFTNLSPEHLPSHNNSYEEYAQQKKVFFDLLDTKSFAVFNADDERSSYFSSDYKGKEITTSWKTSADYMGILKEISSEKTIFLSNGNQYEILIGGTKNAENALLALAAAKELGVDIKNIQKGFNSISIIPGRMEKIDMGQDFTVFVDYAHEEKSMQFIVDTGNAAKKDKRLLVLLGAEGGGRDPRKRPIMGNIVGKGADMVVVSNVDPYEDDPTPICEDIALAAVKAGKTRGKNLFVIEDRKEGIAFMLSLAQPGDIVMITGKGAEQSITIGGVVFEWDDRKVVRNLLSV